MFSKPEWIVILSLFFAGAALGSNENLLNLLSDDSGWKTYRTSDQGYELREKEVPGHKIRAIEVSHITDIDPSTILSVIEDIANYNSIFKSNSSMSCQLIESSMTDLIGYQYYKVPLSRDRYAVFQMNRNHMKNGSYFSDWILLPEEDHLEFSLPDPYKGRSPKSLSKGAGLWVITPHGISEWKISYRLFIDPDIWLPGFILKRINRTGIAGLFEDVLHESATRSTRIAENMENQND